MSFSCAGRFQSHVSVNNTWIHSADKAGHMFVASQFHASVLIGRALYESKFWRMKSAVSSKPNHIV